MSKLNRNEKYSGLIHSTNKAYGYGEPIYYMQEASKQKGSQMETVVFSMVKVTGVVIKFTV